MAQQCSRAFTSRGHNLTASAGCRCLPTVVPHLQPANTRSRCLAFSSPFKGSYRAVSTIMSSASAEAQAFTIVGGGRIGAAIADIGGGVDVLVRRGQPVEGPGPILVCTRNDDLQAVVEATPAARRKDLVFIQNGMLQPWLAERGLADNTQVLVYFAVAKLGDKPIDGITDVNPEGLTAAWGPHAHAVAKRLRDGGLSCKVLDRLNFQRCMLEKLVWISAFMLVGVKHKCLVGEVESKHKAEVTRLIEELCEGGSKALGITLGEGVVPRLLAYARSVAHYPTAIKEYPWRNGWFYGLTQEALSAGKPDPFPLHTSLLKEAGVI